VGSKTRTYLLGNRILHRDVFLREELLCSLLLVFGISVDFGRGNGLLLAGLGVVKSNVRVQD
jgi:hypothetical protein